MAHCFSWDFILYTDLYRTHYKHYKSSTTGHWKLCMISQERWEKYFLQGIGRITKAKAWEFIYSFHKYIEYLLGVTDIVLGN